MLRTAMFLTPFLCLNLAFASETTSPRASFVSRSLSFEANQGQSDASAQFISQGAGYLLQLAPNGVTFRLSSDKAAKLELVHARHGASLEGAQMLPGKANYLIGNASQWRSNIPTYARVVEQNVYPGVDVAYYGNQSSLEFDFVLQPGAQVDDIGLKLVGAEHVAVNQQGDLNVHFGSAEISFLKPVVYQISADGVSRKSVTGAYRLDQESGSLGFDVGPYDHTRPLVIDPVLQYSETLASPVLCMTVDAAGNTYIVSSSGPPSYTNTVMKLSAAGTVLYNTSIGSDITANALAVDSTGRAYIAGTAYSDATLPTSSKSYSAALPQDQAAFLVVVSAYGAAAPYATYLGGSSDFSGNQAAGIAIDNSGNAYLAGTTTSASFPTTSGAYQTTNPNNLPAGFIAKINPNLSGGASLVYSTLIGSAVQNYGLPGSILSSIAVDSSGDAYVTGSSLFGYPTTKGAFQDTGYSPQVGGVYVTRLNSLGTALIYSAYLGDGSAAAIAVDRQSNAYITGTVQYSGFPVTPGAYQTEYAGGFVTKLNPTGSTEVFSTFLGGPSSGLSTSSVMPTGIALTPGCPQQSPTVINCNVYVTGTNSTTDFPAVNAIQTQPPGGLPSLFVVELSSTGQSALLSSYLGGSAAISSPAGPFIGVDSTGTITLGGNLNQNLPEAFPVTVGSSSGQPAFLSKIAPASSGEIFASASSLSFAEPLGVSSSISGNASIVTLANYGSAPIAISSIEAAPSSFTQTNTCGTNLAGGGSCSLTVNFTPASTATVSGKITIKSNALNGSVTVALTGTGADAGYLQSSVSSVSFGTQTVGVTSAATSITVTNLGAVAATPTFQLFPLTDFSETNNCPAQLGAHASCIVKVRFAASQAGLSDGFLYIFDSGSGLTVSLSGNGAVANVKTSLSVAPSQLQFAPLVVGSSGADQAQYVSIINTSLEPITVNSIAVAGDFSLASIFCGSLPVQLTPGGSCEFSVAFAPTAVGARTGSVTVSNSVSTTPTSVALTGTGLASSENLEIYPSRTITVPDQPVGITGPDQSITFENTGTSPIQIYRVTLTGDFRIDVDACSSNTIGGTSDDGVGTYYTCQISVDFIPTTTGLRTGTLTVFDSSPGSPHVVALSGNGITATGTLLVSDSSLVFPTQAVGTVGGPQPQGSVQDVTLYNPGDSPITVTSITTTGDFNLYSGFFCSVPPFVVNPVGSIGASCSVSIVFAPTAAGKRNGSLIIHSSAGTQTVSLTGTGTSVPGMLQLEPGSTMDFGSLVVGQTGDSQTIYVYTTGAVTASSFVVSGANASEFNLMTGPSDCGSTICAQVRLAFAPSGAGPRSATLTLTDSAGVQTLALTGKGLATAPVATVYPQFITFSEGAQGTFSPSSVQQVLFAYNGTTGVALGNVVITGNAFMKLGGFCSGATITAGNDCLIELAFAPPVVSPPANALNSGLITFVDTSGNTLATIGLAGYSLALTQGAQLDAVEGNFAQYQAIGTTTTLQTGVTAILSNTGTTPINVGALKGTNLSPGNPAGVFSIANNASSLDNCSGNSIQPGLYCTVIISFTPTAIGSATGTVDFPVTYADNTKATFTFKVSATGVKEKNSAYLSPASVSFSDTGVGTSSPTSTIVLTNTGNAALTVGSLTGINTIVGTASGGEFSTAANGGGYDSCSNTTVAAQSNCSVRVSFTPSASGTRTGSINFPVTYFDHTTAKLTAMLSGNAISPTTQLDIYPLNAVFPETTQGSFVSLQEPVTVTNTGNTPITFGVDSISLNPAEFQVGYDNCSGTRLAAGGTCSISLSFTPAANSVGNRTGTLIISDNAGTGKQTVSLSGIAITPNQEVQVSQTSLNFGTQTDGTASNPQVVWFLAPANEVIVSSVVLGGANAGDFAIQNSCISYLFGSCSVDVTFAPQSGSSGTRTATIIETDSAPGSPRTITLKGVAK